MFKLFKKTTDFEKQIRHRFQLEPSDCVYIKASDVPDKIKSAIFQREESRNKRIDTHKDVYTPLERGKEWLYKETLKFQPKTAEILLQGSDLFIIKEYLNYELDPTRFNLSLIQEFKGLYKKSLYIRINRAFHGRNLSDNNFEQLVLPYERQDVLPEEIRQAYYYNFDGFKAIQGGSTGGIYPWLFPANTSEWDTIDGYLGKLRLKKKYMPWIAERFPGKMGKAPNMSGKNDPWLGLMCFLDTRVDQSKKEGDVFFVKPFVNDKLIYHIKDGNVENMKILTDYQDAIDSYCQQNFLGNDFDFTPYLDDFDKHHVITT